VDLEKANVEQAASYLMYAGISEPFYPTSIIDGKGYDPLRLRLETYNEVRNH